MVWPRKKHRTSCSLVHRTARPALLYLKRSSPTSLAKSSLTSLIIRQYQPIVRSPSNLALHPYRLFPDFFPSVYFLCLDIKSEGGRGINQRNFRRCCGRILRALPSLAVDVALAAALRAPWRQPHRGPVFSPRGLRRQRPRSPLNRRRPRRDRPTTRTFVSGSLAIFACPTKPETSSRLGDSFVWSCTEAPIR